MVAGAGRSGTLFISRVLTNLGVPCDHEKFFQPTTRAWPADFEGGEASWHVVPFLDQRPRDVVVIHQVRHPVDVVGSLYGREFFRYGAQELSRKALWRKLSRGPKIAAGRRDCIRFIESTIPKILEAPDEVSRCIRYWTEMNQRVGTSGVDDVRSDLLVRVEDLGVETLLQVLDVVGAGSRSEDEITHALSDATTDGSHKSTTAQAVRREALDMAAITASSDWLAAQRLAGHYGYSERH